MATSNGVKKIIITLVILTVFGGGYFLYQKNQALAPTAPSADQNKIDNQQATQPQPEKPNQEISQPSGATSTKNNTLSPVNEPGRFSGGEEEIVAPDIQVWQIDFDGSKFAPQALNVKVGDYVIFKNTGTTGFWPASNPHPQHSIYPEFDSGKVIAPGGKYQFQFEKSGAWGFHDHLNPSAVGTVIVAQ